MTRGGKLDLARLPMPNEEAPAPPDAPAPPSENLALLIGVMRTVLEGEIGPQDNFYALGGDSIKAIQISSRLRERGASLSVGDILRNPQLTRMADFMSRSDADETAKEAQGEVPVTPPIRWFLDQHLAEQGQYNQSMLLRLLRPMSAAQVGPVLEALVQHHDALRLNLGKDGRLFYNPAHRAARVPVEEMSIDRLEEIHRLETSFDLSHQLLLRARMVHCGEERYLFLTLHHLVVDGVSWRILLDDLAALFARQERGEDLRLGHKSDSYQTFARMLTGLDEPPCPACACDGFLRADAHVDHVILPRAVTASLLARREERRRVQDVLLTALYQSLRKTGWDSPLLLEREGHGRDRVPQANTERTVGWFTSFERILVSDGNEGDNTPPDTRVPGQEEEARYGASLVRWNYLGELNEEANGYFEPIPAIWRGDHSPKNRAGCRLCVDVLIARGQLETYFTYSSKDADCQKLSRCFIKTLESILADYPGRLSARP